VLQIERLSAIVDDLVSVTAKRQQQASTVDSGTGMPALAGCNAGQATWLHVQ